MKEALRWKYFRALSMGCARADKRVGLSGSSRGRSATGRESTISRW
jgi:hypothetical protein